MRRTIPLHRLKKAILASFLIVALFFSSLTFGSRQANAFFCCAPCFGFECALAAVVLIGMHSLGENLLENWIENEFAEHQDWMLEDFFRGELGYAMAKFTEQMSAVAMMQTMTLGVFLDAKHQLETQRLLQQLKAQAHKDYQPSEEFCWFGTNVRSLASSETRARFNTLALSEKALARHLGRMAMGGAISIDEDMNGRWRRFINDYCDPKDNNWQGANSGLELACGAVVPPNPLRVNRDVDYTRLIEEPRTLNVDFTDNPLPVDGEEEDVMALANNLYGHEVLTRSATSTILQNVQAQHLYLGLRSVAAKRSVAENSFNAIVGMKSAGTSNLPGVAPAPDTRLYMAAIMNELGIGDENGDGTNEDEIYNIIGERPSYYAQLEILAKRIYQNPNFFAGLYDKPANVERKAVALRAIDLMLGRAMFESQLRREMVLSVWLESELRTPSRDVNEEMMAVMNR